MRIIDLTGRQFGRLTVLREEGRKNRFVAWRCRCECGQEAVVGGDNLRNGNTRSCGCLMKEVRGKAASAAKTTHGLASHKGRHPLYDIWNGMLQRCNNPKSKAYPNYGARGIKVCDRWLDIHSFVTDMGERPSDAHSIERIDVDGDYEPGNCRWATAVEQQNNRRNNRHVVVEGVRMTVAQAARARGVKLTTVYSRMRSGGSTEMWFAPSGAISRGTYTGSTRGPAPKPQTLRSEAYRRLVAAMPCMVCGASPCQAAHPNTGKGMGLKTDDRECFPLCPRCHGLFDQGGLFPKEARRELEPAWSAQTRAVIVAEGNWPARLPMWVES